ncbi:hypothetical protein EYB25_009374 [Talaromyces marneffei]|nr:hypothetical protein EYB25_009374 [Talaromyces marneffei]
MEKPPEPRTTPFQGTIQTPAQHAMEHCGQPTVHPQRTRIPTVYRPVGPYHHHRRYFQPRKPVMEYRTTGYEEGDHSSGAADRRSRTSTDPSPRAPRGQPMGWADHLLEEDRDH